MSCFEHCHFTGTIDNKTGRRLMVKPSTNEVHPRCEFCADQELQRAKLMILFHNDISLVEKYEELKKKVG